jgi:hypothetical protein
LVEVAGEELFENSKWLTRSVLPTVGTYLGHADVFLTPGLYDVFYIINSPDGRFPVEGFGAIHIAVE